MWKDYRPPQPLRRNYRPGARRVALVPVKPQPEHPGEAIQEIPPGVGSQPWLAYGDYLARVSRQLSKAAPPQTPAAAPRLKARAEPRPGGLPSRAREYLAEHGPATSVMLADALTTDTTVARSGDLGRALLNYHDVLRTGRTRRYVYYIAGDHERAEKLAEQLLKGEHKAQAKPRGIASRGSRLLGLLERQPRVWTTGELATAVGGISSRNVLPALRPYLDGARPRIRMQVHGRGAVARSRPTEWWAVCHAAALGREEA